MFKGMAADIAGTADVCSVVHQFSKCLATEYLLPNETIMLSFQSKKEEFTFTNEAFLKLEGENATTTRKAVTRYDYKDFTIQSIQFETAGRADRDCEIKFYAGKEEISIDIAKAEEADAKEIYKVLQLLSRQQRQNQRQWELGQTAIKHASQALRLHEGSVTALADQSFEWIQTLYTRTHYRCYREVIQAGLREVRMAGKMAEP